MTKSETDTRRIRNAESLHRMAIVGVCISMVPFALTFVLQSGSLGDALYAYVTVSPIVWLGMFLVGIVMGSRGWQERLAGALSIIYLFASFLTVRIG